jgi:carboxylesterase
VPTASSAAWVERTGRGGALIGCGDPAPIAVSGNAPAVLALHGFGGTPLEVELVIDAARDLGLEALAPLLPGHGTHARDLAPLRWRDWVAAAEASFDELVGRHGPVLVAGLSMGALLAVHLASTRADRVLGLVMMANACWLAAPFPAWPLSVIDVLRLPDFAFPKLGSDIGDSEARRTNLTYSAQPVHAAIQVLRAGRQMRRELPRVRCPTLVLHGARDRVCPVANATRAWKLLGTVDKRLVILAKSHHILTRDSDRAEALTELCQFFARAQVQKPVEP